jgi:hypothetical protein
VLRAPLLRVPEVVRLPDDLDEDDELELADGERLAGGMRLLLLIVLALAASLSKLRPGCAWCMDRFR